MNDRRQKREDDDEGGLDFELRTHRIERRRKIGINSPGSLEHPRLNKDNQDLTEINVLLKNHVVICLEVEDAQTATCRDLLAMIFEEPEVGLPHEAEDVFALWLVSPLFEVQLKPDHRPLQVCKKWLELLAKYTTANITQRENDFPYLSLQRDVFFSKQEEMRLSNSVALELLYEEAKQNVLCGRYPCDQNTAERMAGMQARIELGKYDHDIHTPAFFKSRLDTFLPPYACKTKRSFFNFGSKTSLEYKLLILFRGLQDDVSPHTIMRQYLEFCWNLPCYGSAFFAGQLEKPAHGLAALIGYQDMPVTVAINSEGVSILSPAEGEVVLGLRYQELSWDSARPVQENNPDCLPCLFLQFQVLEDGQRVFKVLQVFSKQAILMDAIISSFVRALRRHSWDRDEVDDNSATSPGDCTPDADDAQTPLTTSSLYDSTSNDADTFLPSKLQQLSLATFNEDGDCIKLMGSWAFR